MPSTRTPVLFIPGLWLHSQSWQSWIELFREAGYDPITRDWPGVPPTVQETRAHPESMAGQGVAEIVEHYARIIRELPAKPIVIGHSTGGLAAQILLDRGLAAAAVAIDSAAFKGVLALPLSTLRATFPALKDPRNAKKAVTLTAAEFRYGFANAVSAEEAAELYQRWAIPGPARPLFQIALANLAPSSAARVDTGNATRGPLLLITGEKDHTVPPAVTRSTLKRYRRSSAVTDMREMAGRGHSLTIDSGWREVADTTLAWLGSHVGTTTGAVAAPPAG
jgi:pimeloyl-ACP methyl ester carboxylesterase